MRGCLEGRIEKHFDELSNGEGLVSLDVLLRRLYNVGTQVITRIGELVRNDGDETLHRARGSVFPLAEEGHHGPSGIKPGYDWSTKDLSPPAGSTAKLVAGRSDQLLVKGFQLPGDQVKIICTRLAYFTEDPAWIHIAAKYQELSHACASPTAFLRAMLNCMTIAKRKWRGPQFNDKYLLAEFTSIIIDSISPDRFANSSLSLLALPLLPHDRRPTSSGDGNVALRIEHCRDVFLPVRKLLFLQKRWPSLSHHKVYLVF